MHRWHRRLIAGLLAAALLAGPAAAGPAVAGPALAGAECGPATYSVRRGDTLAAIARRFSTTLSALVSLNRLADPNRIYVGQVLALPMPAGCPGGAPGPSTPAAGSVLHVVQRGETLGRIAARYNVTVAAIVAANGIANPSLIYTGQRLTIPAPAVGGAAPSAPNPAVAGLRLLPATPEQGRTLWLSLPAEGVGAVSGALGQWPVAFAREGERWVGLVGVPALAATGTYALALSLTDAAGKVTNATLPVYVAGGGYASETINLDPTTSTLLDPALTIPEREKVMAVVAPRTPERLWQGTFLVPAGGRITSAFGTRRSYNGGPFSSYHAGVDFSYRGGLDIYAPAAGVVVLAEPLMVRGNATIIDHGWGVYSGFWHQAELRVAVGDRVTAGQVIGQIGGTGLATGAHLHWELFLNGVQVDPLQWTRQVLP